MKNDQEKIAPASAEIKALIEKAERTQELFKKSPKVVVSSMGDDPMMEALREYLPESIPGYDEKGRLVKEATQAGYFALQSQLEAKAARGYKPILDGSGHMVTIGDNSELVLMSRPVAMRDAEDAANKARNAEKIVNMKKTFKGDRNVSAGSDGGVPSPDRSGVTADELDIQPGQTIQ